jgi:hypothetical protein
MSDYKEKYLKYKSKYLKLKNQYGGIVSNQPLKKWEKPKTETKQTSEQTPEQKKNILLNKLNKLEEFNFNFTEDFVNKAAQLTGIITDNYVLSTGKIGNMLRLLYVMSHRYIETDKQILNEFCYNAATRLPESEIEIIKINEERRNNGISILHPNQIALSILDKFFEPAFPLILSKFVSRVLEFNTTIEKLIKLILYFNIHYKIALEAVLEFKDDQVGYNISPIYDNDTNQKTDTVIDKETLSILNSTNKMRFMIKFYNFIQYHILQVITKPIILVILDGAPKGVKAIEDYNNKEVIDIRINSDKIMGTSNTEGDYNNKQKEQENLTKIYSKLGITSDSMKYKTLKIEQIEIIENIKYKLSELAFIAAKLINIDKIKKRGFVKDIIIKQIIHIFCENFFRDNKSLEDTMEIINNTPIDTILTTIILDKYNI